MSPGRQLTAGENPSSWPTCISIITLFITRAFVPIGRDSSHGWVQIVTSHGPTGGTDRFDTLKHIGLNRCFMHEAVTNSTVKDSNIKNVRLYRQLNERLRN